MKVVCGTTRKINLLSSMTRSSGYIMRNILIRIQKMKRMKPRMYKAAQKEFIRLA